jgi:hypothetical protein
MPRKPDILLKKQAVSCDLRGFFWPYPISQPLNLRNGHILAPVGERAGKKMLKMKIYLE